MENLKEAEKVQALHIADEALEDAGNDISSAINALEDDMYLSQKDWWDQEGVENAHALLKSLLK